METTFGYQKKLPVMPVPNLSETCQKLRQWAAPLQTPDEQEKTKKMLQRFMREGSDGPLLQSALVKWQEEHKNTSWVAAVWKALYLDSREPLPINSNVFYYLKSKLDENAHSQAYIAAALVLSVYDFIRLIDEQKLSVDRQKEVPLCMNQYKHIFSSMRIPHCGSDEFYVSSDRRHILVMNKGKLYKLNIIDEKGDLRSLSSIETDLGIILRNNEFGENIGLLTTLPRDEWADIRADLIAFSDHNCQMMTEIENAAFALCLDENRPEKLTEISPLLLYGDGKDRFFDKSLQFIVFKNGKTGINFEHTGVDGSVMLRLIGHIYDTLDKNEYGKPDNKKIETLNFDLNQKLHGSLFKAQKLFVKHTDNTRTRVLDFTDFGKNQIKKFGVSPDAFVQLALQLAEHKLYGKCYSAYEAVMTRTFLDGRIDVLYTVSPESLDFIDKMRRDDGSIQTKIEALVKATQKHQTRARECRFGQGVYSHLLALKYHYHLSGKELGIKNLPEIFTDPGYLALTNSVVCTSTTAKYGVELAGYGPIVDDGYGIRYFTRDNSIRFNMTSRTAMEDKLEKMRSYIEISLSEMAQVMCQHHI